MIRVVLDASVIMKWFVKEIYSGIALKLREDYLKILLNLTYLYELFLE
ncbi:MAG: hypothetical protein J7L07_04915 [Candidatus Odinarchaeota archaeon]|nr:hypothetical protein [Candidatus Odinarchaeota archaeon]